MTGTRIRSFFPNLLRRLGGFSCTGGGKNSFVPFELPKRLYIPNNKAFNSIIKGHFSGGDNQNIKIPEMALGVACMATLVGDQDDSSENDEDIEELDNEVITESPEGDESDVIENNVSYLEDEEDLSSHKLEIIGGDKEGSEWLVLDDVYILHKYRTTREEVFWECSGRRAFDCPFKAATSRKDDEDEGGNVELVFMYRVDSHDCGQTKLGPILQKFRNSLKMKMGENFKNKFHNVFAEEKKALLNRYKDDPDLLERIIYELKENRSYRVCAQRARARKFPKVEMRWILI